MYRVGTRSSLWSLIYRNTDTFRYITRNSVDYFIIELLKVRKELAKKLNYVAPIVLCLDEEKSFQEVMHCFICHISLDQKRSRLYYVKISWRCSRLLQSKF